jgi:ATP-dependent protease ClpP protease subunit
MKIINISGEIGWDVTPENIKSELTAAQGADLDVHIASPGGLVFAGIEIYNQFRDYKRQFPNAQLMVTVKGLAASMASYLAMNPVFDIVSAEDNAVFMIHNAWGGVSGDYRDLKKTADILEGLTDLISIAYISKTKKSKKEIREMMDNESWFFGSELKDSGFVDEIIPSIEQKDKMAALAESKLRFSSLSEKIQNSKIDIAQIAAMLEIKPEQNPANAGNNIPEVKSIMSLKELLDSNPAAKAEHDVELSAKFEAGKKSVTDMVNQVKAFLAPDCKYPNAIKQIAVDVVNGTKSVDSLNAVVAAFDALRESEKSDVAKTEQPVVTPGQQNPVLSTDGIIRNEYDQAAQIKSDRKKLGLEVK